MDLLRNQIPEDQQYKVHNQEILELMVLDLLVAVVIKLEILTLAVVILEPAVVAAQVRSVIVEFGQMMIHLTHLLQEKVAPAKMFLQLFQEHPILEYIVVAVVVE